MRESKLCKIILLFFIFNNLTLLSQNVNSNMKSSSISNNRINYIIGTTLVNLSYVTIKNSSFLNITNDDFIVNKQNYNFNDFAYYPNPVEDKLFISNVDFFFEVNIYNELGQLIGNCSIENDYIDLSKYKKGIYIIEIIGKTNKSFKIIKN